MAPARTKRGQQTTRLLPPKTPQVSESNVDAEEVPAEMVTSQSQTHPPKVIDYADIYLGNNETVIANAQTADGSSILFKMDISDVTHSRDWKWKQLVLVMTAYWTH